MKAVVYNGPRDVGVRGIPDPRIEQATDALVQITSTNICGAPDAYAHFNRRDEGWTKVVLRPGSTNGAGRH